MAARLGRTRAGPLSRRDGRLDHLAHRLVVVSHPRSGRRAATAPPRETVYWPGAAAEAIDWISDLHSRWKAVLDGCAEADLDEEYQFGWPERRPLASAAALGQRRADEEHRRDRRAASYLADFGQALIRCLSRAKPPRDDPHQFQREVRVAADVREKARSSSGTKAQSLFATTVALRGADRAAPSHRQPHRAPGSRSARRLDVLRCPRSVRRTRARSDRSLRRLSRRGEGRSLLSELERPDHAATRLVFHPVRPFILVQPR